MKYKQSIMWKIYVIWAFRQLVNATSAKLVAIALLIWQLTSYVSFTQVVKNLPQVFDLSAYYTFAEAAVLNTEITTQLLLVGILMIGALFVLDVRRKDAGM